MYGIGEEKKKITAGNVGYKKQKTSMFIFNKKMRCCPVLIKPNSKSYRNVSPPSLFYVGDYGCVTT